MYFTEWFVTLYTRSFPFDLVVRVFDVFFFEGWKIIFRVALALLKLAQPLLLKFGMEGVMAYFRKFPASVDADKVMGVALNIRLTQKRMMELENEYRLQANKN